MKYTVWTRSKARYAPTTGNHYWVVPLGIIQVDCGRPLPSRFVNNSFSKVNKAVPRGSILGPSLFPEYLNDIITRANPFFLVNFSPVLYYLNAWNRICATWLCPRVVARRLEVAPPSGGSLVEQIKVVLKPVLLRFLNSSNFWVSGWKPEMCEATEQQIAVLLLIMHYNGIRSF